MILYVSRFFDTLEMFMPQRLDDCLEWEWEGMGIAQWESHGNGNWLQNWEWEWEGMGINHVGIGGKGNVKSHSRSSPVYSRCPRWMYAASAASNNYLRIVLPSGRLSLMSLL